LLELPALMTPARLSHAFSLPAAFSLLVSACGGATVGPPAVPGDAGSSAADAATDEEPDASTEGEPPLGPIAVPLFSCVPAVYTAAVTIGATQQFQLSIDTGSTSLGVASTQCSGCGVTPLYAPGSTAVDEGKMADSQYGSGSWTGEVYEDAVAFDSRATTEVALVAIDTQSQFFQTIRCDSTSGGMQGIVGFGPAGSALPGTNGFFDELVARAQVPDVFATELCDTGGTLWLGGYDASSVTAAPQYVPFNTDAYSPFYYTVNLTSVSVNGTSIPIATAQYADTVVDTGTSVFLLGLEAYGALTTAIASDAQFQKVFGGAAFFASQGCAAVTETKAALDAALPALTLTFGSTAPIRVTMLATDSYLFPYGADRWCPALDGIAQSSDEFPLASILGAPLLRSSITIFDRANHRLGFAPHAACP
jgi:hypothetical protein